MAGRKTGAAYELYGFIPKLENGKHVAICTYCNRVLQNTAAVRMQKHRRSCIAGRADRQVDHLPNTKNSVSGPNTEFMSIDATPLNNSNSNNVKLESSVDFDVGNLENNTCDETLDHLQDYIQIQQQNTSSKRNAEEHLKTKIAYFKEKSKFVMNEMKNLKLEKTLMVLEIKKLRLEIEQLQNNHF